MRLWIAALAIEYAGPAAGFWTPWNGASSTTDWQVDGGHMAERSALFVIIALGESVLVTGATFAAHEWSGPLVLAFLASFVGTVAMWWLYFSIGADTARHNIEHSDDPGRIARVAFTYLPVLLIAGIVVAAVADELVLAHPLGHHAEPAMILTVVGGPALYRDRQHAVQAHRLRPPAAVAHGRAGAVRAARSDCVPARTAAAQLCGNGDHRDRGGLGIRFDEVAARLRIFRDGLRHELAIFDPWIWRQSAGGNVEAFR